jgi:hypothetical protein
MGFMGAKFIDCMSLFFPPLIHIFFIS